MKTSKAIKSGGGKIKIRQRCHAKTAKKMRPHVGGSVPTTEPGGTAKITPTMTFDAAASNARQELASKRAAISDAASNARQELARSPRSMTAALTNLGSSFIKSKTDDVLSYVTDKVDVVRNTLEGPQGKKLLSELGQVSEDVLTSLKPGIDKATEIIGEEGEKLATHAENAALNAVGMIPVVGEVGEAVRVVGNLTEAGLTATQAAADLTGVGADSVMQAKSGIRTAAGILGDLKHTYDDTAAAAMSTIADASNSTTTPQHGGKRYNLSRIHKECTQCASRVLKSRRLFLQHHPHTRRRKMRVERQRI